MLDGQFVGLVVLVLTVALFPSDLRPISHLLRDLLHPQTFHLLSVETTHFLHLRHLFFCLGFMLRLFQSVLDLFILQRQQTFVRFQEALPLLKRHFLMAFVSKENHSINKLLHQFSRVARVLLRGTRFMFLASGSALDDTTVRTVGSQFDGHIFEVGCEHDGLVVVVAENGQSLVVDYHTVDDLGFIRLELSQF